MVANMKKTVLYTFFMFFLISCTGISHEKSVIGIYKVSERDCKGNSVQIEVCKNIVLIEFVKGKFHKVRNNEVAFVVWSNDDELTYNARKIESDVRVVEYPTSIIIDEYFALEEKIVFDSDSSGTYVFPISKDIVSRLKIEKATDADLAKYNKQYPEAD
jgi:hypothetical protein